MASFRVADMEEDRTQTHTGGGGGGEGMPKQDGDDTPTTICCSLSKFTLFMRVLFVFQAITQLYVTVWHLLPFILQDIAPGLTFLAQLWAVYFCAVMFISWICVMRYSCVYTPSTSHHDVNLNGFADNSQHRYGDSLALDQHHYDNNHVTVDVTDKGGLPWRYCTTCKMDCPPRSVHCKFCKVCILRRDHHCYLVGVCIGHFNQRFFVVMAYYGMVLGYLGFYLTLTFLYHHHDTHLAPWDYVLPLTIFKWVGGGVSGLHTILTFHAYMLFVFAPIANIYCFSQMCLIGHGLTKHEVAKKKKVQVTSSCCANFRLVFGRAWWLNFVFPAHLHFPQTHTGIHFANIKLMPE